MKRIGGYHILFGLTLMLLTALAAWWGIFFMRSVEAEREARLGELEHAAVVTALLLGHEEETPTLGLLPGAVPLEVVPTGEKPPGPGFAAATPLHGKVGVRPTTEALQGIDEKVRRRRIMLVGEGALMLVLLLVCTFMLYRLVRQERRHLRRMEAFVAAVSHEMKTPLTGIKSLLQTFAAGRVPEKDQAKIFSLGLKETERLEHMVENILISGRLRGGRFEVHNEAVQLRPFIESFVDHRKRYLIDHPESIELAWEAPDPDRKILCDSSALNVALENLVDNAFKYGGPEPLTLVRVTAGGSAIEVSVEDRGVGFEPGRADELFVPFHRAMEARTGVQHGTGLGLSIARELVERMGGRLTASSSGPGKGSRFTIRLKEAPA